MKDLSILALVVLLLAVTVSSNKLNLYTAHANLQTMTAPSFLDSIPNIPTPRS
jgi:purine-cytosine permease-like protein